MNCCGAGGTVFCPAGAGENARAADFAAAQLLGAIIVMLVTSTAMFLFAVPIIDLFTDDTETILLAAQMLRIEAFAEPLLAIGVVLGGVLRGAGDTRWPFVISLLGMWGVRLPLAYTLIHLFDWGLAAVWGAAIADWAVRAAISCHRFYHKKWMTQKV